MKLIKIPDLVGQMNNILDPTSETNQLLTNIQLDASESTVQVNNTNSAILKTDIKEIIKLIDESEIIVMDPIQEVQCYINNHKWLESWDDVSKETYTYDFKIDNFEMTSPSGKLEFYNTIDWDGSMHSGEANLKVIIEDKNNKSIEQIKTVKIDDVGVISFSLVFSDIPPGSYNIIATSAVKVTIPYKAKGPFSTTLKIFHDKHIPIDTSFLTI